MIVKGDVARKSGAVIPQTAQSTQEKGEIFQTNTLSNKQHFVIIRKVEATFHSKRLVCI